MIIMFNDQYWDKVSLIVGNAISAHLQNQTTAPKPMTVKELAAYLSLNEQTIYRYTSKRKIPFSKTMGNLYFDKVEIDKWLLSNKPKTAERLGLDADDYIEENPIK